MEKRILLQQRELVRNQCPGARVEGRGTGWGAQGPGVEVILRKEGA